MSQADIGSAASAIPTVPTYIYNPWFGRTIQKAANQASRVGGCIEIGIKRGGPTTQNYVTVFPAQRCAR